MIVTTVTHMELETWHPECIALCVFGFVTKFLPLGGSFLTLVMLVANIVAYFFVW